MAVQLPSAFRAKYQARLLRKKMSEEGTPLGHAESLELVAHQYGFRDWNAMNVAIGNGPPKTLERGDKISGRYMSQPFTAHVVTITLLEPGWCRLELHLDEAVDVVTFDSFSNLRQRIRGVIGPKGHSIERTSNGEPHLQIDLP